MSNIKLMEVKQPSGCRLSSSTGSTILVHRPPDWYFRIYIRVDLSGRFHTYPHTGGPFQSLQETQSAIDRHLHDLEHPTMCKEALGKLSKMDWLVRRSLYWPDGKRKKLTKSQVSETTRKGTSHLLQALVDKYNDEHNLLGDLSYELKDILQCQTIYENHIWYEHFNFTTKTKGADGIDSAIENLFFAELTYLKGDELAVSCMCMIDTNANGHCYGCKNNGSVHLKHPNTANAYTAGSLDGYLPFGIKFEWDDPSISVEKDEERLRRIYKGLDDPHVLARIATPPPYATDTFIQD
ncbi:uncharacterized protein LOC112271179 [Brachypodium distachyon]|nr:uncharacterized protein LOC112271179 [Brachypodium distachyon]|eukprot:XP_024316062.1 uncharacterized protein LOC112271179 [Brachypodium distachyon]